MQLLGQNGSIYFKLYPNHIMSFWKKKNLKLIKNFRHDSFFVPIIGLFPYVLSFF